MTINLDRNVIRKSLNSEDLPFKRFIICGKYISFVNWKYNNIILASKLDSLIRPDLFPGVIVLDAGFLPE